MTIRSELTFKARILSQVRSYFASRDAVEVHTPTLLEATVAHPTTRVFKTVATAADSPGDLYLQPSPELAMRDLIGSGSGEIFQLCKAYRDEETDATHGREFMLLEWYVPGMGYLEMASAVCDLVSEIMPLPREFISCAEIFSAEYDAFSLHSLTAADLMGLHARVLKCEAVSNVSGVLFDNLLSHAAKERARGQILCIYDYPMLDPCFARLARGGYVERFEILYDGVEIANGYQEIEQGSDFVARFNAENQQRSLMGTPPLPEIVVGDIETCSGVAIGLDRLVALAARQQGA